MYDEYVSWRRFRRDFLPSAPTLGAFLGFLEPLAPLVLAPSALGASVFSVTNSVSAKSDLEMRHNGSAMNTPTASSDTRAVGSPVAKLDQQGRMQDLMQRNNSTHKKHCKRAGTHQLSVA